MRKFREFISEEILPFAQTEKGFVGIDNGPVRDNINLLLANVTAMPYSTPYHAMEAVRRVLMSFHIALPATNFMSGDAGHEAFPINQFGKKMGVLPTGDVVTQMPSAYYVYFEYEMNDRGSFEVFCEVVDEEELNEILNDVEEEEAEIERDAEDSYDAYKASNMSEQIVYRGENKDSAKRRKIMSVLHDRKTNKLLPGMHEDYDSNEAEMANRAKEFFNSPSKVIQSNARKIHKSHNDKAVTGMKEEEKFDEQAKWRSNPKAIAKKENPDDPEDSEQYDYYHYNPKSTGRMTAKGNTRSSGSGLNDRRKSDVATRGDRKGKITKAAADRLKSNIVSNHYQKEETINEISQKAATSAYAAADDPDYDHPKADKILGHIRRKFGAAAEKGAEAHSQATHWGRGTPRQGSDSLSGGLRQYASDKVTKSGKIPKGTQTAMKNRMDRSKWQGHGRKVGGPKGHLPEEAINELSKGTLGSYITKASHDVATKSAAVGRYAERSRNDQSKSDYMSAKKHDDVSNKMFKKSWKRRQGIAKATDKLTREEAINEISKQLAHKASEKAYEKGSDYYDSTTKLRGKAFKSKDKKDMDAATAEQGKMSKKWKQSMKFKAYADKKMEESKEDAPFDNPTSTPSTPYKNPASKAKQLARQAMKMKKAEKDDKTFSKLSPKDQTEVNRRLRMQK